MRVALISLILFIAIAACTKTREQVMSPFDLAAEGDVEALAAAIESDRSLLTKLAHSKKTTGKSWESSLLHSAGSAEVVALLVEKYGMDPNMKDKIGWQPLSLVKNRAAAEKLIALGAKVELEYSKANPLSATTSSEVAMLLIGKGADPKKAMFRQVTQGNAAVVEVLIKSGVPAGFQSPQGEYALHRAARYGRLETVKVILEAGFPIDTTGKYGDTALHHASMHGKSEVVSYLLERGADRYLTLGPNVSLTETNYGGRTSSSETDIGGKTAKEIAKSPAVAALF